MPTHRHLPLVLALQAAFLFSTAAQASEHTDAHAAPAKPAAAEPAKPVAAAKGEEPSKPAAEEADAHGAAKPPPLRALSLAPLDQLREKLAAKMGATKPDPKTPYVVQVASKASNMGGDVKVASLHGAPSAPRGQVDVQALVDSHRQEKAGMALDAKPGGGHGDAPHWSYTGETGPQSWASLKPDFAKCAVGTRQSPIDIRGGVAVDLEPVQFDYKPSGFSVIDNGHTVQVNMASGNAIQVTGRRYDLVQFHFHRPSEERVNGRQYDMVAHLVHKDPEGRLAVVAVLLERGAAQTQIQTVWNNLPLEKGEEVPANAAIDLNQLLPQDKRYYTFMGSLTTPPCSEGVLWMVLQQPVQMAQQQVDIFAKLYPMNARPIQQASGRLIKQSN